MGASSKRERRVQMRKRQQKQSRKPKFDTRNEPLEVARSLSKKKFTQHDLSELTPASATQEYFLNLYYQDIDMLSVTGPSGTGKTMLAMWCALSDVFDQSTPYDKVVIIRSAVESRSQGFLPGALDGPDGKNAPFETPYEQVADNIFPDYNDAYQHLKSLGYLEFHTTGYLRGQTFDRAIILCDELQNADYAELRTVIERCGLYSRIVLMGDLKQCDLQRKNQTSGFQRLHRVMHNMPRSKVGFVEYTLQDIQRSGLVKDFLIADNGVPD